MTKMIDLEFIRKWVKISEEELMMRLVKDAIALQKEAENNKMAFEVSERLANPEYARIVLKFWNQVSYLKKYFTDDEIIKAAANHLSMRSIVTEEYIRGKKDCLFNGFWEFIRYGKHTFTESKGGWTRDVVDTCSVFRVPSQYQAVSGGNAAVKELLELKLPYLKDYDVKVYEIDDRNDWIYISINNHSLYCPVSALMDKDSSKIKDTHLNYWHQYGNGKYDDRETAFIESDEVKNFLNIVANS